MTHRRAQSYGAWGGALLHIRCVRGETIHALRWVRHSEANDLLLCVIRKDHVSPATWGYACSFLPWRRYC